MFLADTEIQQLNSTRLAMWDGLQVVEDFVCHQVVDPVLVAATSKRAIALYRLTGLAVYHTVMLAAAAAFYSGILARYAWEVFVRWAADYVARCEESVLALPPVAAPLALLAPAIDRPRNTVELTKNPVLVVPAVSVEFEPISVSREVAVSANKLRMECDRLRCLITDEAAYTMDERKTPNFRRFIDDLEQCAREVARLYCKRSKSHDSYKESLIGRANTLIERNRKPQGEASLPKPQRHLAAVK